MSPWCVLAAHRTNRSKHSSICLWNAQKKKPVFTQALAHGFNQVHSETEGLIETPRWITAIASLRYSDLFASGMCSLIE